MKDFLNILKIFRQSFNSVSTLANNKVNIVNEHDSTQGSCTNTVFNQFTPLATSKITLEV